MGFSHTSIIALILVEIKLYIYFCLDTGSLKKMGKSEIVEEIKLGVGFTMTMIGLHLLSCY